MEARAPAAQGLGVVVAVPAGFLGDQSRIRGKLCHALRRRQHAARKDIDLDEVRRAAIDRKDIVADGDDLERDPTARSHQPPQCLIN